MWLVLLLIIGGVVEAFCAAAYHLILIPHARYLIWDPDMNEARKAWAESTKIEPDKELGWPAPATARSAPYDEAGAKLNADFPVTSDACASAYGDSFVWGYDVPHNDGWIEQLSRRLGCRVSNFGVSGYGVDQAYLRFRQKTEDKAPTVMLGIYPQDVMRNVNQYRSFLGFPLHPHALKGRFILTQDKRLEWRAPPALDLERFLELNRSPEKIVPDDYILPGSLDGPTIKRVSYTWTLLSLAVSRRVLNRLSGRGSTSDFLDAKHPSGSFELTLAIVDAFDALAKQRGQRLLVVMLPGASSLRQKLASGAFDYEALQEQIASRGVAVFDLGRALLAERAGRPYCDFYTEQAVCDGHYSVAGGVVISQIVADELRQRQLVRR